MVQKCLFTVCYIISASGFAQSIQVESQSLEIEGKATSGYQVVLHAAEDEVRTSLSRFAKTLGRSRTANNVITIAEPTIDERKMSEPLFVATQVVAGTTAAWFGSRGDYADDLRDLAYHFGVTFHRERIQAQIDESMRALQAVERQQSKLTAQQRDLLQRIEANKREKEQLQQALVNNSREWEALKQRVANNSKAQDSVATAAEQIRRVVEMHRERQRNVR